MKTAVELYKGGYAPRIIVSGGIDVNEHSEDGIHEAKAMRSWAVSHGVPDACLIVDEAGADTRRSARSCAAIARRHGIRKVMVVSHYYHNARVKLAFERQGLSCLTVPARQERPLRRELWYLLRECLAFPFYYLRLGVA